MYGDPTKPALVFMHGIRLGRAMWKEHAQALEDTFCSIAIDLPGHGAATDIPFNRDTLVGSIDAALDANGIERATI